MTGIVLAGGSGTRLYPLTAVINKHILPVFSKPLVYYPVDFLLSLGIRQIVVVVETGLRGDLVQELITLMFGADAFVFIRQNSPKGTGHALSLCKGHTYDDTFLVILGDNIFEYVLSMKQLEIPRLKIFYKPVLETLPFGTVTLSQTGEATLRKKNAHSSGPGNALVGLFLLNSSFYNVLEHVHASASSELDIVDALILASRAQTLDAELIEGFWLDAASTPDALLTAGITVQRFGANKRLSNH